MECFDSSCRGVIYSQKLDRKLKNTVDHKLGWFDQENLLIYQIWQFIFMFFIEGESQIAKHKDVVCSVFFVIGSPLYTGDEQQGGVEDIVCLMFLVEY